MYDSRFFLPPTNPGPLAAGEASPANGARSAAQVAQDLITAWNDHDADQVAACYAADFVGEDVAQAEPQHGPAEVRRLTAFYFRAFPDLQVTVESLIVQGDQAVLVWTWRGTHRGTFMRIPPTGRPVVVRGSTIFTLSGGLIRRAVRIWDVAGLLRAVGLLPEL